MKRIIAVLVETTLEPENLQVELDENITKRTTFVSNVMVQKPAIGNSRNGNGNHAEMLPNEIVPPEIEAPPPEIQKTYEPPKQPNACDIGGG